MSLFRRKLDNKEALDESSGASASPGAGEEVGPTASETAPPALPDQQPVPEQVEPEAIGAPAGQGRELHGGLIVAPVAGSIVSGVDVVQARLAEMGVPIDARLEWSRDGESWSVASTPGDDYEIVAARTDESPSRIALIRSTQPSEQAKRSFAREGFESIEPVPARPSSWRAGELFFARWDTSDLSDGDCLLRLVTIVAGRSETTSDAVRVRVDNLGPELRLSEELGDRPLAGRVTLLAEAEDAVSGVSVVELEISTDGKSWRRISDARRAPYELRMNADELADGTYQLRVVARDGSGNLSRGEPWEVEIASAPVAAELIDPGKYLRGSINLIARAPDGRSAQMIFELAATGSDDWRALGTARPPFHLSVDTRQVVDGSYELRIESLTAAGLSTHSGRFGPYIVDNTPPSVEIIEPRDGSELSERAELVVRARDESSGPARVVLSFTEEGEWRPLADLEPEAGEVRGFWQIDECKPGHCQLRATAYDRAGNSAGQIIGITIMPPEPEPEKTSAESSSPPRAPSPVAAARFGSVPNWDWRRSSSEPEKSRDEAGSSEQESPTEPGPEAVAEAATAALKPQSSSVAWSWKAQTQAPEPARRSEDESAKEIEPEPEAVSDAANETKQEHEPEHVIRLVEPGWDEVAEEEKPSEPDPGAEAGGRLVNFPSSGRGWNIWLLSELVEEAQGQDPIRQEERRQILFHLRDHAELDGLIPPEFEDLVYEAFGDLMPDDSTA